MEDSLTKNIIKEATNRIAPYIHCTPLMVSRCLNDFSGAKLFFKCENFQKAGSFKMRGAANAVLSLSEEQKRKGVCTHSSGNFAQALALAAKACGIKACIVMPDNAPQVKKEAVAAYGAEIYFCQPTLEARVSTLNEVKNKNGSEFIHPYNDYRVIAGHASIITEIIDQLKNISENDSAPDYIISPVGGGGLISAVALGSHYFSPAAIIIGAEPEGAADAASSLKSGKIQPSLNPKTIADGLLTSLGDITFPVISEYVKEIITVSDQEIIYAMRLVWERMKIIIEPSSAVTLAAVLKNKEKFKNKRVALILSGGNVDLSRLPFT